jgi:predicted ATPase
MIHLRSVTRTGDLPTRPSFPFSVPAIGTLETLEFLAPVTFFVGENGSGKSTLLEAIALAAGLPAIGQEDLPRDATLAEQRVLARQLRLTWTRRTTRGFFLRAEDFFGFSRRLTRMRDGLQAELDDIDREYAGASDYARGLRRGPVNNSLSELERRYGVNLDANSHGQSFLRVFQERLIPGGLYLLDEPETPLSPQNQLALLAMLRDLERADAQCIIASHSPILLAYPGATLYSFDEPPVRAVPYDSLSHVTLTRDFLQAPERYLRHL